MATNRQFLMMVKLLDTWLLRFHEKFSDISYVLLSMITWWAPLGPSKIIALIPDRESLYNAWWAPVGPSNISWNRMSMSFENIVEISRWFYLIILINCPNSHLKKLLLNFICDFRMIFNSSTSNCENFGNSNYVLKCGMPIFKGNYFMKWIIFLPSHQSMWRI